MSRYDDFLRAARRCGWPHWLAVATFIALTIIGLLIWGFLAYKLWMSLKGPV